MHGESSPESQLLRRYRDEVLSKTASGRLMIKLYYRASPMMVGMLDAHSQLQDMAVGDFVSKSPLRVM